MTPKERAAMQQALNALVTKGEHHTRVYEAITALREALAEQAEQEPVAWAYIDADGSFMDALDRQHGAYKTPLYAAPVRTKDLTDDEIVDVMNKIYGSMWTEQDRDFARAVIAADREKNK